MRNDVFVILYEGRPLVVLKWTKNYAPLSSQLLDEYATKYAFVREKLTGTWIESITQEEFDAAK